MEREHVEQSWGFCMHSQNPQNIGAKPFHFILFTNRVVFSSGDERHVWCKEEICRVRGGRQRLHWWKHVLQPAVDVPTSVGQRRECSPPHICPPSHVFGTCPDCNCSFLQILSSPSPSSSGQLSQLGASLYGPQSKNTNIESCTRNCFFLFFTLRSLSEKSTNRCLSLRSVTAGALGFSVRGMGNSTPQLNRNLTQGTQLASHITPTTGIPTMSLHTPPSPSRWLFSNWLIYMWLMTGNTWEWTL